MLLLTTFVCSRISAAENLEAFSGKLSGENAAEGVRSPLRETSAAYQVNQFVVGLDELVRAVSG